MTNGGADGLFVAAVGLDGDGAAAGTFDRLHHVQRAAGRGGIGQGDGGAVPGQTFGDGGADAAGTALDECDFSFEGLQSAHVRSPGTWGVNGRRPQYSPVIHNR
ncbi:hypothetical protein D3C84_835630 [compost metagenome]